MVIAALPMLEGTQITDTGLDSNMASSFLFRLNRENTFFTFSRSVYEERHS